MIKIETIFESDDLLFIRSKEYDIDTFFLPDSVNPIDVVSCKRYVQKHGNILKGVKRSYIYSMLYPIMIVEISTFPNTRQQSYRLWLFREDKYSVIKFKVSPSYDVVQNAINDIYNFEGVNKKNAK